MFRKKQRLRVAAIFCLLTFVQSLVLPPVARALTAGPTAPEASSFEPVDTTDMVNLATGDFTYNIPLLEVPGPEGGYPLALAYHAGIKPLAEASWVGLGWNLSPGAINRTVNAYPDDHLDVQRDVRDYWEGGTSTTFSVGVGLGLAGGAKIGMDLAFHSDTYQGNSGDVGMSLSIGNFSAGLSSARGGFYASASLGLRQLTMLPLPLTADVSLDRSGLSADAAIKAKVSLSHIMSALQGSNKKSKSPALAQAVLKGTSVGFSLSTDGLKSSYKIAGTSTFSSNSNAGRLSTQSGGFTFGLGIVSVAHRYQRYWIDQTDIVRTHGVLHFDKPEARPDYLINNIINPVFDKNSMDSYLLRHKDYNPLEFPDPADHWGGSFPAYDNYQVTGQGIGGNIQPYRFENGTLYRKGTVEGADTPDMNFNIANEFAKPGNFRFVNDFSNALTLNSIPTLSATPTNPTSPAQDFTANSAGFNVVDHHLAGSRHIEWHANADIISGTAQDRGLVNSAGVSNTERSTFRDRNIEDQIGAFTVTNLSGVNYHYAQPVYAFDEYYYTEIDDPTNGDSWNEQSNPHPYAYTWLLTSVTGSDYVDRNNNGVADAGDFGYWVNFEYGKWLEDYEWRTPHEGSYKDIQGRASTFSHGKKQIYYLDAITTRTHTALFVKDIRQDGKEVVNRNGTFEGGESLVLEIGCVDMLDNPAGSSTIYARTDLARSLLKLDKIVLIKNFDLGQSVASIKALKDDYDYSFAAVLDYNPGPGFDCELPDDFEYITSVDHLGENILDVHDYQQIESNIAAKVISSVELDTDYSLSPETVNSFDNALYYSDNSDPTPQGKLTLRQVQHLGQNQNKYLPPLNFTYDLPGQLYDYSITSATEVSLTGATADLEGSIFQYQNGGLDYYLLLSDHLTGANFEYQVLGRHVPVVGHTGSSNDGARITKNPPYKEDKFDTWGYYKSDFSGDETTDPSSVTRNPSFLSAEQTDVWSLREIETSLGAKIGVEYGPRKYDQVVYQKTTRFHTDLFSDVTMQMTFKEDADLTQVFDVNQIINWTYVRTSESNGQIFEDVHSEDLTVVAVNKGSITLSLPSFINDPAYGFLPGGFVDFNGGQACGDGIQVNAIEVRANGNVERAKYDYFNGVLSYVPSNLQPVDYSNLDLQAAYYDDLTEVVNTAREIPAPQVMYEFVEVSDEYNGNTDLMGKRRYHFKTFDQSMLDFSYTGLGTNDRSMMIVDKTSQIGNVLSIETYAKDPHTGGLYLLSKVVNDYTDDEAGETESDYGLYADQGRIEQAFNEVRRFATNGGVPFHMRGVVSVRKDYPSILKSATNFDQDGEVVTTHYREYDFYSGLPRKVENLNGNRHNYVSLTRPAYTISEYDNMGLKVFPTADPSENKHMLSQTAASYSYYSDGSGNPLGTPLQAEAMTWNDEWYYRYYDDTNDEYFDSSTPDADGVWRKHQQFVFNEALNSTGRYANWEDFDWTPGAANAKWLKTSEITRYDHYSKALEACDVAGDFGATKMGYGFSLPLITAGPAKYVEMAYSGAEDPIPGTTQFGGEVQGPGSAALVTSPVHTGDYSIELSATNRFGFGYDAKVQAAGQPAAADEIQRQRYEARVWVHESQINTDFTYLYCNYFDDQGASLLFQGSKASDATTVKAGEWYQLRLSIDLEDPSLQNCTNITVGTYVPENSPSIYLDDFRFAPAVAAVSSYVYDYVTDQVTYVLDQEHFYTQYVYDDAGRLIRVIRETTENPTGHRLVTESEYHYQRDF